MIAQQKEAHNSHEHLLAELTVAAHQVALRYEFHRSFADAELELWETLRDVVERHAPPSREFAGRLPAAVPDFAPAKLGLSSSRRGH